MPRRALTSRERRCYIAAGLFNLVFFLWLAIFHQRPLDLLVGQSLSMLSNLHVGIPHTGPAELRAFRLTLLALGVAIAGTAFVVDFWPPGFDDTVQEEVEGILMWPYLVLGIGFGVFVVWDIVVDIKERKAKKLAAKEAETATTPSEEDVSIEDPEKAEDVAEKDEEQKVRLLLDEEK
ncbi:hypothetical protein JCM8547_008933 [Rhodosporidiobolus lusitaniae]